MVIVPQIDTMALSSANHRLKTNHTQSRFFLFYWLTQGIYYFHDNANVIRLQLYINSNYINIFITKEQYKFLVTLKINELQKCYKLYLYY